MLSFSNFGSVSHPYVRKVQEATRLVRRLRPDLMVDGEMQADTAVDPRKLADVYPFSQLQGGANVLVFPTLGALVGSLRYPGPGTRALVPVLVPPLCQLLPRGASP